MKDFWKEPEKKKINPKKIVIAVIIMVVIIAFLIILALYINDDKTREWIDVNIFKKEILQENTTSIEINSENVKICAFNQYIGVLSENQLKIYNNTGNEEANLTVEVTNPIFNANNRFLAIGETDGKKAYLITDKEVSWSVEVDGNISQIHVNKNGYVAVVITDTSYKTIIDMYTPEGKEMFKTYLSSTRTADVSISRDNKYLAIAEIDVSGTTVKSNIKVISIEKAQNDPLNSVEKTYNGENGKLLTNIEYQEKNKLACMYTDTINIIEEEQDNCVTEFNNKKISFASIELNNSSIIIEEVATGLFTADSVLSITNSSNKEVRKYTTSEVTKEIYTAQDLIALNLGTELEFINSEGWLVKRYIAKQEITNIVLTNGIAGIIYRDRIELINL